MDFLTCEEIKFTVSFLYTCSLGEGGCVAPVHLCLPVTVARDSFLQPYNLEAPLEALAKRYLC